MSFNKSKILLYRLSIKLHTSYTDRALRLVVHLLALIASAVPMAIPGWLQLMLVLFVLASFLHTVFDCYRPSRQCAFLHFTDSGAVVLRMRNHALQRYELSKKIYRTNMVIVLTLKSGWRNKSLRLWRDAMSYEDWRKCHAWLAHLTVAEKGSDADVLA